ncbi:MAG: pitrilysin family protein [Oscillospiraceae bacterium]|nr:pitrilysin family protein [Oscillospiraceae bacterium]
MTDKFRIITLDNGLRIVIQKNGNAKTCSLGVWVGSGSCFETPETAGTSHFIEHMLFKGTEKRSALDIAVEMDEIGGVLNAYTAKEMTCFYAHTLSEHSAKALDIICDMIMNPKLSPEDIELEKGVIREEIAMYEDSPEDLCADSYYEKVWRGSMLGSNILGTNQTVDSVTRESLSAHMKKFYVPERTVVSFSGNFDENEAVEICKKYFSGMKNTGFELTPVSADYSPGIFRIKKDFMQNQLILGFPGIPLSDKRRDCASLISSILGASSSSRLFQTIREKLGLAYSVDCVNVAHLNAAVFIVCMGLSKKSEEQAIAETLKIISEFAETVTEKELARAKEQTVAGFVMSLESVSSIASRNGKGVLLHGRPRSEEEVIKAVRGVTLDEIKQTAKEIFDFSKLSLCCVGDVGSEKNYRKYLKIN